MKTLTVLDLIATARATLQYERAAERLFRREDRLRAAHMTEEADAIHRFALIAGHAAYAEQRDPDVFR
jgi:hypothetical protein